ncbi:uncharacterized protein N7459_001242 [Penicillium hispanicum]|uniref:uncharacterized protein n=1 Tax=Penicillium hispanicum TaxID=1080232 RepID=UPI002540FDAE|nr:uncharacterized protein N7459_001242 [Penicillium hispanicum]KAJ5595034.1 hypothetical protein N7459_001242 [Penicillium hispanicum]
MKRPHKTERPPETPRDHFRTPSRVSPPGSSRASKSTLKQTVSPHISASGPTQRRTSLPSLRAQSTLTQIDFVTQATQPDDEELDYIDGSEPREDPRHTNKPIQISEASDDDADYRPPSWTRFETNNDHPKRRRKSSGVSFRVSDRVQAVRKSQTPKAGLGSKGKRKPSEKPPVKPDKTLTQMDFVRRYITIDDDDNDVNMGYIQPDPQKTPPTNEQQRATTTTQDENTQTRRPISSKRSRVFEAELDLSTGEPISHSEDTQPPDPGDPPITPQKPRKLEIPSSQSPESPGLAIITSSQFRSATRSPSKRIPFNFTDHSDTPIKEESPVSRRAVGNSENHRNESPSKSSIIGSPRVLDSPKKTPSTSTKRIPSSTASADSTPKGILKNNEPQPQHTQRERTVVYETDAETEPSDYEGDLDNLPVTLCRHGPHIDDIRESHHSPQSPADDSQELPLPEIRPSADLGPELLSEPPMSDASVFYQRMQPATQFPHEPIPTLNTQKLSELFPNEGSTQKPGTGHVVTPKFPGPFSQSQTQSQDPERIEIVPESSPVREQENNMENEALFRRPRAPESVQVESSQPIDRGNSSPNGVLSRSQLLTSSVMESVPMPNFWMGSQDSVGEPYSLPDR